MPGKPATLSVLLSLMILPRALAAQGFVTETFGNTDRCGHKGTLARRDNMMQFDLSALPRGVKPVRATLRVDAEGHRNGQPVRLRSSPGGARLALRPPYFRSFDATALVTRWLEDPRGDNRVEIVESGGVKFDRAVLEVSYCGGVKEPIRPVAELAGFHQSGQTFVTWKEIEDVVGDDAPLFADFEKRVLDARARREVVYRIYCHSKPITAANLGESDLVAGIPEALSCWNLKAIRNTEHPNQGTPTKHSPLRPGYNLALNHVMERYRIRTGGESLPRGTALAVLTATEPAKRYYAVTAAIDGREAVAELGPGASLEEPVDEKPSRFPAIIYQRTRSADPGNRVVRGVDVHNSWLEPPYHNVPILSETYIVQWANPPKHGDSHSAPLWLTTGHYGDTATEMGNPGWHAAREYVKGAFTIGLTEGSLWQGFHECIGTLRGYDDGVVHDYPQRRVLAAAQWAVESPSFSVDPERVSIYGQFAAWALRHGDVFAAVMSNGHGNLAVGKEVQKHGWKWGPYPEGSKNGLGIDQWEYMNLPKWIRENPTVELPFWICHPAYGSYPSHTIGDFGFMPWPEMLHAMASTKRAFAANWSSNGPGPVRPLYDLVTRIRRDQSLPAFTNCSLDHSPGDGDHADAEKGGGINIFQRWEPESIVDEPDRWEITVSVSGDCPQGEIVTDLTPRRCQKFRVEPGGKLIWVNTSAADGKNLQSGRAVADRWGLATIKGLQIGKTGNRIVIKRE